MKPLVTTVACLLLVPAGAQARALPRVAPQQDVVELIGTHTVRLRPTTTAKVVASVRALRPITREHTTLPVLTQREDSRGHLWLRVRLPGRVIGTKAPPRTGWISAANTLPSTTPWHIVVDTGGRKVMVYREGKRLLTYRAVVGKSSTPTPRGDYFVEETVRMRSHQPGAPFALALSARSNVLQEFEGGPGQVALHGVGNVGGKLGTAASHGCVRLANKAITWLAARIGPGIPVTIV